MEMDIVRRGPNYIGCATWLKDHPAKVRDGFRPSEMEASAYGLQVYRKDVELWVAMKMTEAVQNDGSGAGDGTLMRRVIRELHNLPWDAEDDRSDAPRGFFFINPVAQGWEQTDFVPGFGLRARGYDRVPRLKARGIGVWKEPRPHEFERWQNRLATIQLYSMANRYAQAALSGQSLGGLSPQALLTFVEAAVGVARRSLPMAANGRGHRALPPGPTPAEREAMGEDSEGPED